MIEVDMLVNGAMYDMLHHRILGQDAQKTVLDKIGRRLSMILSL